MKIKNVKRKRLIELAAFLSALSLCGCGQTGQEQKAQSDGKQDEAAKTEMASNPESEPVGEQKAAQGEAPVIMFPEKFSETIGNVTFDMDIIVDDDLTEDAVVTSKLQMQKVNQEKAFQLFYSGVESYDTYDYEGEDEYGKAAHQTYYRSPEGKVFGYGCESSKFDYMEEDLMTYVMPAFVTFHDDRYNADLFSTEEQLSFMSREEAFQTVQNALQAIDINVETDYKGFALDHQTMQSQEYHENIDGNIDRSQYKAQWTAADDCYYFFINQTYKGLPLYYVDNTEFMDVTEMNAPIQAVVSGEGIKKLEIDKVFTVCGEESRVALADMDLVVKTVADKYNQLLGDGGYEITKAQLYYYVDLHSGMGIYDVKPVWILTGKEKGGKNMQMFIDAQTAEEILP